MENFSSEWMAVWQQKINSDPNYYVVGKYFDCAMRFDFGEKDYVIKVKNSKCISGDCDTPVDLEFIAKKDIWEKFLQPIPPAGFNGEWALNRDGTTMEIKGDLMIWWQNARAINRLFELMREAAKEEM